jgi:hypothetical protein
VTKPFPDMLFVSVILLSYLQKCEPLKFCFDKRFFRSGEACKNYVESINKAKKTIFQRSAEVIFTKRNKT